VLEGRAGTCDTFVALKDETLALAAPSVPPHQPGSVTGSLDPRA
jgi:hypothetical protein